MRLAETRAAPLLALTTLAVAEPIFDLLARHPDFWVARHVSLSSRLALALLLFLLPPLMLWLPVAVADRWNRRWGRRLLGPLLALPASLLSLIALKRAPALSGLLMVVMALGLGTGLALLHRKSATVRWMLGVLALLSVVSPIRFAVGMSRHVSSDNLLSGEAIQVAVSRPKPVVIVIFDELPISTLMNARGRVDEALFPHFARVAGTSVWFRNATSSGTFTMLSIPSILTGRYPVEDLVPTSQHYPGNLFTLLEDSHSIFALEPRTELCPSRICDRSSAETLPLIQDLGTVYLHILLPEAWASALPDVTTAWGGFVDAFEDKAADVRSFLERLEPSSRPPLVVLHIVLPHHPWIYLPSGQQYHPDDSWAFEGFDAASNRWTEETWPVTQGLQRHLLQTQFADLLLGEVEARLRNLGWWEPSLVVITADHGVSFEPGAPARLADRSTLAEVLAIPLFVKLPGQKEAKATEVPVELVDLVPTLLDVLGIEVDWTFDGRSLFSEPAAGNRIRHAFNKPGKDIALENEELPGRRLAVARKYAWLARDPSTGAIDPYRAQAASPALVGVPISSLALGTTRPSWEVEVEGLDAWDNVDPEASWLPARTKGRVSGAPEGSILALAVNDIVRATTRVAADGHFSFMLPPESFRTGRNEARLFALSSSQDPPVLQPLEIRPEVTYLLKTRGPSLRITSSDGSEWEAIPGSFEGGVQDAILMTRTYRVDFIGWGRSSTTGEVPGRYVMFVDGVFHRAGPPNLHREDLSRRYRLPGRQDAGFVWTLPRRDLDGEIRFFALGEDGKASELTYERRMSPQSYPASKSQSGSQP